jgi:predicted ATP-grasp superfamily ATP-dependent carboligase
MTEPIQERVVLPQLKDPVLVSAFTAAHKGGATATAALSVLLNAWNAQQIAEFEAEDCYNYARLRPTVTRNDGQTAISWPTNYVYLATPPESDQSFLFLVGIEPSLKWRSFADAVAQFALRAGVRTAISLRSVPGSVTHTQPPVVQAVYSNADLAEQYKLPVMEMTEHALDMGALINLTLQSLGCQTVDLFAVEPFYTTALPDANAGLGLLDAIGDAFKVTVPHEQLAAMAQTQREATEVAVASSEQAQAVVRALENRNVATMDEGNGVYPSLPPGSDTTPLQESDAMAAVAEVEALFRMGNQGGKSDGNA